VLDLLQQPRFLGVGRGNEPGYAVDVLATFQLEHVVVTKRQPAEDGDVDLKHESPNGGPGVSISGEGEHWDGEVGFDGTEGGNSERLSG
jgi:hypothetical protein